VHKIPCASCSKKRKRCQGPIGGSCIPCSTSKIGCNLSSNVGRGARKSQSIFIFRSSLSDSCQQNNRSRIQARNTRRRRAPPVTPLNPALHPPPHDPSRVRLRHPSPLPTPTPSPPPLLHPPSSKSPLWQMLGVGRGRVSPFSFSDLVCLTRANRTTDPGFKPGTRGDEEHPPSPLSIRPSTLPHTTPPASDHATRPCYQRQRPARHRFFIRRHHNPCSNSVYKRSRDITDGEQESIPVNSQFRS
jgi:hypothetical protein